MHRAGHRGDGTRSRHSGRCRGRRVHRRRPRARARLHRLGLNPADVLDGALFAALIAFAAWRAHALTAGGAVAAFVVGTLTFGSGSWAFTLVLLAFFVPSVALSRLGRARKKQLVDIGKGGARDAWQVAANGGVATACAVVAGTALGALHESAARLDFSADFLVSWNLHAAGMHRLVNIAVLPWMAAFAGAYAAATADTWGTEIGTLARGTPHSILTLRPIPAGLSGGVTWAGTAAEAGGAVWIALAAAGSFALLAAGPASIALIPLLTRIVLPVAFAGIIGALVDSLLGATVQELRRCPACERACETNPHVCGTPTLRVRGLAGFSNDAVNFAATFAGAAVAFATSLMAR